LDGCRFFSIGRRESRTAVANEKPDLAFQKVSNENYVNVCTIDNSWKDAEINSAW